MLAAAAAVLLAGQYQLPQTVNVKPSVVERFTLAEGPNGWRELHAIKKSGAEYRVWWQQRESGIARYVVQEGGAAARDYRHEVTGEAVLPQPAAWELLVPSGTHYLGHEYVRTSGTAAFQPPPSGAQLVLLRPDMLVGQSQNIRQKDETRRYDQSDYELVPLTRDDHRAMAEAGVNCVNVDATQLAWAHDLGLFYWGPGGASLAFPESLYRSQYLGPALFLDEPAVGTRDHILRPRLAKDEAFRRTITPQIAFDAFRDHFAEVLHKGPPAVWMKQMAARADVDLGDLQLVQRNLYTWETMPETAAWQLSQGPHAPAAFVFEPPGRIGARRTIPEMDMAYGIQLPPDDPKALTSILFGFLRGAARLTNKHWGVSIYGQVDRADAPFWLTHAYDLGATHFFFWPSYQLAAVPFGEVLAHARHLRAHARQQPPRDLVRLRRAAELAIVLPRGYGLGHVQTGKGSLWGVGELNLERRNGAGATYREVMSAFFTEVERAFRSGVAFDLLWDIPGIVGYRQVVRVGENPAPASPPPLRAPGSPPGIDVTLTQEAQQITARATVTETAAPVWYTLGADTEGVHRNAAVAWELYGPGEEDYLYLMPDKLKPDTRRTSEGWEAVTVFRVPRAGTYRLRAATVDLAGRSSVVWKSFTVR